ncbi:hypothetical protein, partial [Chromobacterium haemolyticum]|uniref:hypothetical protein n=1 Tax=Chromobacterium haemolyticum TaxID=394935 RepID=UPI001EE688BF
KKAQHLALLRQVPPKEGGWRRQHQNAHFACHVLMQVSLSAETCFIARLFVHRTIKRGFLRHKYKNHY